MSANASAGESTDVPTTSSTEYDELLDLLDGAIKEAHRKIESGRVYDPENERVRQGWIKALAYAVNVRRQVTVDRDLEELTERIERIEEQRGIGQ